MRILPQTIVEIHGFRLFLVNKRLSFRHLIVESGSCVLLLKHRLFFPSVGFFYSAVLATLFNDMTIRLIRHKISCFFSNRTMLFSLHQQLML